MLLASVFICNILNGSFSLPNIKLPDPQPYPSVACSAVELDRLRNAFKGSGIEHEIIAKRIQQADQALINKIEFPPEGGQHNQWYQCDKCQIALKTIDDTHHVCPKCNTVYSGYPYDNVIYSRKHNRLTSDMYVCAWAYSITGESKYAQKVRDILVGYAKRYTSYPYHSANMGKKTDKPSASGGHVFEQTLNEADWMHYVCTAYDLVRKSNVFSESDHRSICDDLLMKVYENIAKHKAGKSNWQTYHNSAFMYIGGVLNKVDLIRQALEDKENGFYYQMNVSVLPGGMWYENSWGYHFYTLRAVQQIMETARRLGIDLYSIPQVKEMYMVAMDYQMADGTLPRFGDSITMRIPGGAYESAYHIWKEPLFLSVLPQSPTWDSILYGRKEFKKDSQKEIEFKSKLKEGAGYAVLQSNGEKRRSSAVLVFSPFGGFHGHFDKLSFVYYAMNKELGYDPGRAVSQAYRLPIHRDWYRATISHNTVLVDRKSQGEADGISEFFVTNSELSAASAYTDKAYPGILHRRLLILRPSFLIVTDILKATDGKDHIYDWIYHNLGEEISSPVIKESAKSFEGQGFEYISDPKIGTSSGIIRATIKTGEDRVEVIVNAEEGSEVLTGYGVGESILHRVPLILVKRNGKEARFSAVIEPIIAVNNSQIENLTFADDETSGYIITIQLKDGSEEIYAYDPEKKPRVIKGIKTNS
ncbi:MAG: heparinase II/III domain-containing protein, partial [Candidatus Poribacteria bacterium]